MENKKSKALIFANFMLGSAVISIILAIIYTWYKENSVYFILNSKSGIFLAIGLPLSIAALYVRDTTKINIATVIVATVVTAYFIEFVLFISYTTPLLGRDRRSKSEVLGNLRAYGIDAWPNVNAWNFTESNGLNSSNSRIFPVGGISRKTVVHCNEGGKYQIFKSDEHGFNNPIGLYRKGTLKIALLGDSFTMGHCVDMKYNIAGHLRNEGIRTLNLGNDGNGPLLELASLKEYAELLQPEIVLWIYYEGNDLVDLSNEQKSSMLINYLNDNYSQNLIERQSEIDNSLIHFVNSQNRHIAVRKSRNLMIQFWYLRNRLNLLTVKKKQAFGNQPLPPDQQKESKRRKNFKDQLPLFSSIMATAYKRVVNSGAKFFFVYLTKINGYADDNKQTNCCSRKEVLEIVNSHDIPLMDFHSVLKDHPEPLSLTPFPGAHYNANGYKLVSEFIIAQLRKEGLIANN